MFTASFAAGATSQPVARVLFFITSGLLMVTSVITAESMEYVETQSRTLSPPITGYKSQNTGKYWTGSQCPTIETSHQPSVDACADECTINDACNAFTYSSEHQSCTLYNCFLSNQGSSVPNPTGSYAGLVAYSNKAECSFDQQYYTSGSIIVDKKFCAQIECNGPDGEDGYDGYYKFLGYDEACMSCMTYWDPHVITYDQSKGGSCDWDDPNISWTSASYCGSFSYQKCGNFSLTQSDSSYEPTSAVYADFVICDDSSRYTCVGSVYFKNDEETHVSAIYEDDEFKVHINGINIINNLGPNPQLLLISPITFPVLAWTSTYNNTRRVTSCLNLQGTSGFLVRYCGDPYNYANTVVVLAHPGVVDDGVQGLCGNANDNVYDDLTTRDGSHIPVWERETLTRWQANENDGDGSCEFVFSTTQSSRISKITQNRCELDPSVRDGFLSHCETAINDGLSNEETNIERILIDDCVYDLCNVTDPDAWMETIQTTIHVRADIKNNTLESIITTYEPTTYTTCEPSIYTTTTELPTEDQFIGPFDFLNWSEKECPFIEDHSGRTLPECKQLCLSSQNCTAINYNEAGGCELRSCSPVPRPTVNNDFSGGYAIAKDMFTGPSEKIWSDSQCPVVKSFTAGSLTECMNLCLNTDGCTAFNAHEGVPGKTDGCVLRGCKSPIPPPMWDYPNYKGYAISKDMFTGPLKKIWVDSQCPVTKSFTAGSLSDCMTLCLNTDGCTAFNAHEGIPGQIDGCVLRGCKSPIPRPTSVQTPYKAYAISKDTRQCTKKTKKCSDSNGECYPRIAWQTCDGKLKKRWCKGKHCGCCIP